jgi:ABC-type multidrug transport system fused ATPase/permease subunit
VTLQLLAQEALDRLVEKGGAAGGRKRTTLVIAHRLSTIQNADRIVVRPSSRRNPRAPRSKPVAF